MTALFKVLNWQEARQLVTSVNSKLAALIDRISPSSEYVLYHIKYRFGDDVLKDGHLHLPTLDNRLIPLTDIGIPSVQEDLNYNFGANPVSLVLKNSAELFLKRENRIIPFSLIPAGKIFGLWRLLDRQPSSHCPFTRIWGITAGARSLFMLPKISDAVSNQRLRKQYQLSGVHSPKSMQDHWPIFKEIASQNQSDDPWETELLLFSQHWFKCFDDPGWKDFHRYLLESAWNSSGFWRNQFVWQLIFSMIQNMQRLKAHAYFTDLVQHAFMVGVGAVPGFTPAVDDTAGPITQIQNAYIDGYNLKKYCPIIMQPNHFSQETSEPVYISLQHPTALELAPKFSTRLNALADLATVRSLVEQYMLTLTRDTFQMGHTLLSGAPQNIQFDYFHSDPKSYPSIRESSQIPLEDDRFNSLPLSNHLEFPADSSFFKGCIRVSKKAE